MNLAHPKYKLLHKKYKLLTSISLAKSHRPQKSIEPFDGEALIDSDVNFVRLDKYMAERSASVKK